MDIERPIKKKKYKIKIEITGEGQDTSGQDDLMILQALTADPTLLQDPIKKKIFFKILEKRGFDIADFQTEKPADLSQLMAQQPVKGSGGGVSRPGVPRQNINQNNQQTL